MSDDEWKDFPDGQGWWWRLPTVGIPDVVYVSAAGVSPGQVSKWQRVKPHSPVPQPLPRSKQVTLTAKVVADNGGTWYAQLWAGSQLIRTVYSVDKERVVDVCRWTFGIEPEMEVEP